MPVTEQIEKQLQSFGLKGRQIKIYLSLVEKGIQTPTKISRNTGIHRTSVYRHLEKLINLGLVEEVIEAHTTKYQPAPPENLKFLLTQKEIELDSLNAILPHLVTNLTKITSMEEMKGEVKFFRGVTGLRQLLWNITKSKEKLVRGLGYLNWSEIVGRKFADKIHQELVLKKIHSKELTNTLEDGTVWTNNMNFVKTFYKERYIAPKELDIKHDTYIYDDLSAFYHTYKGDYFGVEIQNKEIAKTQKQLFDMAWKLGEDMIPFGPFKPRKRVHKD